MFKSRHATASAVCSSASLFPYVLNSQNTGYKECVAVLIELYKNSVSVSCVGSHFSSDWALYTMTYSKDVARLEYPLGLDLIMGRY